MSRFADSFDAGHNENVRRAGAYPEDATASTSS
jgi:hypothetical protein